MNLARYRKGVIAVTAAVVTVAAAFNIVLPADLSDNVVAVFDALSAALVIIIPND